MRDVIVVGAGYAGLAAALELSDAGADVLALEADSRVGGRAWTSDLGTVTIDQGGQWVGPTQTAFLELAQRFGCETFRSFDDGRHVETWDGVQVAYRTGETPAGPGAEAYHHALDRLEEMALDVDVDDPTACPRLVEWDSTTFETWLTRETDDAAARARLRLAVRGVWACEPREVSLFHVLFYVRSAGGFTQLMETHDNAQDSRFVHGAQAPALAMAAELGDRVRLGETVVAIDWSDDGATVRTTSGTFTARRVVVTGTPAAQARIDFTPALPTARRRWLSRSPMGDVAKVHVVYGTPFWRDRGLSGQVVSYGDDSPISYTFDNSPAEATAGVLVAFVYGDAYRAWAALPEGRRRARVLDSLVPVLGDEAAHPVDYVETRWPEHPIADGAYAAVPTPGSWTAHGRTGWRDPVGPLVWAGTETASRWNGYIDGAVRSGQQAAATTLARLHPDVPLQHS